MKVPMLITNSEKLIQVKASRHFLPKASSYYPKGVWMYPFWWIWGRKTVGAKVSTASNSTSVTLWVALFNQLTLLVKENTINTPGFQERREGKPHVTQREGHKSPEQMLTQPSSSCQNSEWEASTQELASFQGECATQKHLSHTIIFKVSCFNLVFHRITQTYVTCRFCIKHDGVSSHWWNHQNVIK